MLRGRFVCERGLGATVIKAASTGLVGNLVLPQQGVIDKYAPTSVIGSLAGGEVARKPAAVAATTSSKPSGPGCFAAIVSSLCGK
mmetsp:Transcript_17462/g.46111  ORF Transcript_17462/g.46111 Transcript_17462/m.46111 type:complete len:85 (-) Transcript_17462:346-600(-)